MRPGNVLEGEMIAPPRVASTLLLALALLGSTAAAAPTRPEQLDGIGTHWRIPARRGPIHVLRPAGYRRAGAGIVLYVHGFNNTVDRAWREHRLARQLTASKRRALYIAVAAPRSLEDHVKHPSLERVLGLVARRTGLRLPDGHVVAVGHSGGYWTIACWLDHARLDRVILLDGMYGFVADYRRWLRRKHARIVFVARGTRRLSRRFVRGQPGAVTRSSVPRRAGGFTDRERAARVLHIDSQYTHTGIVRTGRVIPVILTTVDLAPLGT